MVAFACVAPNLWWNWSNDFATVSHTGENIGWARNFPNPGGLAEFVASQFAVMGPILFAIYIASVIRLPLQKLSRAHAFLIAYSLPVLAMIILQALLSKAYANWAALTYVAGSILVADIMVNRIPSWWLRTSTVLHLLVFAVLSVAVAFSRPGQLPLPDGIEPFGRMHGAVAMADATRARIAAGRFAAVLVDDRRTAALLHYYLRDQALPILSWRSGETPRDHFELTRPYQAVNIAPVLLVTRNINPAAIVSAFGDAELLGEFDPESKELGKIAFYALSKPLGASQ